MTADNGQQPAAPARRAQTRREFIRGMLRGAGLGVLAALGAALAVRGRRAKGSETCVNRGICRGCGVYDACLLPQAQSAKYAARKRRHG